MVKNKDPTVINKAVSVLDLYSGSVTVYKSVFDCAKHFGDIPERLLRTLEAPTCDLYLGHYLVSFRDEEMFPKASQEDIAEWIKFRSEFIVVTDKNDKPVIVGGDVYKLAKHLKLKEAEAYYALHNKTLVNGYKFAYVDSIGL